MVSWCLFLSVGERVAFIRYHDSKGHSNHYYAVRNYELELKNTSSDFILLCPRLFQLYKDVHARLRVCMAAKK